MSWGDLQNELTALRLAYASGVTKVRYDGKETTYDTGAALLTRIRTIESEMAKASMGADSAPVAGFATFQRS